MVKENKIKKLKERIKDEKLENIRLCNDQAYAIKECNKANEKIERLQNVIKQKDKALYDIKMGLLNIYKASDKLTTGNIVWLKEIINTLLGRE